MLVSSFCLEEFLARHKKWKRKGLKKTKNSTLRQVSTIWLESKIFFAPFAQGQHRISRYRSQFNPFGFRIWQAPTLHYRSLEFLANDFRHACVYPEKCHSNVSQAFLFRIAFHFAPSAAIISSYYQFWQFADFIRKNGMFIEIISCVSLPPRRDRIRDSDFCYKHRNSRDSKRICTPIFIGQFNLHSLADAGLNNPRRAQIH